jgi:hypothetical protein
VGATLVQKKGAQSSGSVASLSVTLDAPPTPGNLLVACCNSDATVATPSGFTLAVSAVNFQGLYIFYRVVQVGDGSSVAFAPSVADSVAGGVIEYSGLTSSPLDQTASNTTTTAATSLATGTTGTTSQANELLVVVVGPHSGSGHPWNLISWSAGYTSQIQEPEGLANNADFSAACHIGDRIVSATGTYSATGTWTPASSNAGAAIATFRIADAGQTVTIGRADEADSAQQIRPLRIHAIGQATEAESAFAIRPLHVVALGTAVETDSAAQLGRLKIRAIGRATEADTALGIGAVKGTALGFDFLAAGPARTGWQAGQARTLET